MNPFKEKVKKPQEYSMDWKKLYPKPYDKHAVDPYTKARIILMNGTEFEANWFSHQFLRHTADNDLRRDMSAVRAIENNSNLKFRS